MLRWWSAASSGSLPIHTARARPSAAPGAAPSRKRGPHQRNHRPHARRNSASSNANAERRKPALPAGPMQERSIDNVPAAQTTRFRLRFGLGAIEDGYFQKSVYDFRFRLGLRSGSRLILTRSRPNPLGM